MRALIALGIALAPLVLSPLVAAAQSAPALATTFARRADTLVARVDGPVPVSRVHRLVQELSIAPGLDDTTLFTHVASFRVDRAGRFWVYDQPTSTIFLFDAKGALLKRIGRRGGGPGELRSDNGSVVLSGDRFAVWDAQNGRISWFAADGAFERTTPLSKGFYTFNGLATDRSGALLITLPVEPGERNQLGRLGLVRIRADGSLGDSLVPPDLEVEVPEYVAVSKDGGARATYYSRNSAGTQTAWHADGHFVTLDGSRSRIVLSRRQGGPLVIERRLPNVPLPREERADDEAFITWGLRQTVPDWTWTGPAVPASKPALDHLLATRDGRLWVQVATPSERIPDSELPTRRPDAPPPYRFRSPVEYEVFASDGRFLARVAFPRNTHPVEADGDIVWALGEDEGGLPALRRYRLAPALPR